jgi:small subunit ribosomal protein S7
MPRKGPAPKRPLVTDPVYSSPLVTQLVNKVLLDGKRSLAERIVYGALEGARDKSGTDPVITLKRALDNVKPTIEVKSRRVGGATYQVPVEVRPGRSTTLALRWIIQYSRARREKTMTERLMNELLDASNGLGASVKRREDTHKMAESNRDRRSFWSSSSSSQPQQTDRPAAGHQPPPARRQRALPSANYRRQSHSRHDFVTSLPRGSHVAVTRGRRCRTAIRPFRPPYRSRQPTPGDVR